MPNPELNPEYFDIDEYTRQINCSNCDEMCQNPNDWEKCYDKIYQDE